MKLQSAPEGSRPGRGGPANFQFVKLGNKVAPVVEERAEENLVGRQVEDFVPLTALGVVALGGAYYYPDAYLTVARPYCSGITPDGCRLNWQRIDFEDGGSEWQCVQFCRRAGLPPPPRTVALVAPPPMAQGGACETVDLLRAELRRHQRHRQRRAAELGRKRLAEPDRFGEGEGRDLGLLQRPAVHRRDDAAGARRTMPISARSGRSAPARSCACSRKSVSRRKRTEFVGGLGSLWRRVGRYHCFEV